MSTAVNGDNLMNLVKPLSACFCGSFILLCIDASADSIQKSDFGKTKNGEAVAKYTLTNRHGVKLALLTYGATIQRLSVPDKHGKLGDVALGFDDIADYEAKSPYFGATVGRFANRIAKGTFELNGKTYHVPVNNGPNSLHGGKIGYDKRIWKAKSKMTTAGPSVRFSLLDPDGDQGYPGNVNASVVFTLLEDNTVRIKYTAVTDHATPINLTNHSYWNLRDGGKSTIKSDRLKLFAKKYTPTDSTLIPTGKIASVAGTPYNFLHSKPIGKDIDKTPGSPNGYDVNFVLGKSNGLKEAAEVFDPVSGRHMTVLTTEPGIQFYSGNFLDGSFSGKKGIRYNRNCSFALEAQHFPDSPNQSNFPSSILKPGQIYRQTTEYRFSVGSNSHTKRSKTTVVVPKKTPASAPKKK